VFKSKLLNKTSGFLDYFRLHVDSAKQLLGILQQIDNGVGDAEMFRMGKALAKKIGIAKEWKEFVEGDDPEIAFYQLGRSLRKYINAIQRRIDHVNDHVKK